MERAGRSFAQLKSARACLSREEWARVAWPAAVGKRLAGRTRVSGLVRERLVVEVEDAMWQRNLHGLRKQILGNLGDLLGAEAPADVEFRIGVPRRPPQREERLASGASLDEADLIDDPVMARIYRISRRKALA